MSEQIQSLDRAMSSMELGEANQDQQCNSGPTKRSKRNRINIIRPRPQRNTQLYGYWISEAWLYRTALIYLIVLHPDRFSQTTPTCDIRLNTAYAFRKIFNISLLSIAYAIPSRRQIVPDACMIDGTTLVLYICSDQPVNYHHRPAQKQVDRLTWLMGTEPEWWIRDSRMFLTPNAALGCHSIPM